MITINILVFFACFGFINASGHLWNYDLLSDQGPENWKRDFPTCGGLKQSPIHIDSSIVHYNSELKPLSLGNYHKVPANVTYRLTNTGQSVKMSIKSGSAKKNPITITHRGVTYILEQFHIHWGIDNFRGSEHILDGRSYSAEMHLVHYNVKYSSLMEAVSKHDGLLVWGHFIQVGGKTNEYFQQFMKHFPSIRHKNNATDISVFSLSSLFPKDSHGSYYTYPGSLTTPSCYESVTWIVSDKKILISTEQLKEFRSLESGAGTVPVIIRNFRPPQPLYGRVVQRSFQPTSKTTSGGVQVISVHITILSSLSVLAFWNRS